MYQLREKVSSLDSDQKSSKTDIRRGFHIEGSALNTMQKTQHKRYNTYEQREFDLYSQEL